ncbi:MAG TPA: type IV conjugative transfer system coupling protein TraD [Gammaproteobacteria bacterium]|nr:type IV conjugative transfer system coupling protein TraD [Gammaproteobacteria bacterium]
MQKYLFKHTTRGGQVILHNLRMIGQVLGKVLLWLSPLGLLASAGWFIYITQADTRHLGSQWLNAQLNIFFNGKYHVQKFILPDGQATHVYSAQIISAPFVQQAVEELKDALQRSLWVGLCVYILVVITTLVLLRRHGDSYTQRKSIKGDYLGSVAEVKKLIQHHHVTSSLIIGKERLPLPQLSELQHFMVHGTTGSGKSTVIKSLLDQIRARGERAIIYDKSCTLVSQFYEPSGDSLLNPLDERGAAWNLWNECRDKTDFENLAAALIPMTPNAQDPFWINAARTIFAAAAYRMRSDANLTTLSLLRYLLTAEIGELQSLLQGTEAESLISEKTEKTAISIKSMLATYLKSLCYLKEGENPFSIRQWLQDDGASQWLFISSLGDKHESLKPLITAWLDIAVNAILSLPENSKRRIWVILDELSSLQQLPYLTSALAEGRKFGACFVIGIQSIAQLAKTYGHEGGREISSLLNTRFLFRIPDPDIAQWSAKNLGETTLEETREGISYGASAMRDGVSLQKIEREKPVIPPSEIMRLPDLCCYVRLAGGYPIVQLTMPYIERPIKESAFILRNVESSLFSELEQLLDKHTPTLLKAKQTSEIIASSLAVSKIKGNAIENNLERLFN